MSPLEGVADDTARWRVEARHDDVAGARGGPSPTQVRFSLAARGARAFPSVGIPRRTSRTPRGCAWRQSTVRGRVAFGGVRGQSPLGERGNLPHQNNFQKIAWAY